MSRVSLLLVAVAVFAATHALATPVVITEYEDPFCGNPRQNTSLNTGVCYSVGNVTGPRISFSCRPSVRLCFSVEVFNDQECSLDNLESLEARQCDSCSSDGSNSWRCVSTSTIDIRIGCTQCANCSLHALVPVGQCSSIGRSTSVIIRRIAKCNLASQTTFTDPNTAPYCKGKSSFMAQPTGLCYSISGGGSQKVHCDASFSDAIEKPQGDVAVLEMREGTNSLA